MKISRSSWLVLGLGLLAAPLASAQSAEKAPTLLVFVEEDAGQRGRSWVAALAVQLTPYGIRVEERAGRPSGASDAVARGRRVGAIAVTWYRKRRRRIHVHAVDLARDPPRERFLTLRAGFGVERSMAAAVRTLLRARLLEVESARRRAASQPTSAPASAPASRPVVERAPRPPKPTRARVYLQAAYEGDLSIEDPLLRHAPVLAVGLRYGRWQAELWGGYGFWGAQQETGFEWKQQGARAGVRAGYRWPIVRRLALETSLIMRVSFLEATAESPQRKESERSWELGVGASAGLALRLHRRIELAGTMDFAGLAVAPEIRVGGEKVGGSSAVLVVLRLGLRLIF